MSVANMLHIVVLFPSVKLGIVCASEAKTSIVMHYVYFISYRSSDAMRARGIVDNITNNRRFKFGTRTVTSTVTKSVLNHVHKSGDFEGTNSVK